LPGFLGRRGGATPDSPGGAISINTFLQGGIMIKKIAVFLIIGVIGFLILGCSSSNNGDDNSNVHPATEVNLPPDPGEAGKATAAGIDSDNDGIRDDVQRYIALTYPDSEDTQKALSQYTRPFQSIIINSNDKEKVIQNADSKNRAMECIFYVRANYGDAASVTEEIKGKILNTEERIRQYLTADRLLSGQTFPTVSIDERHNSCNF